MNNINNTKNSFVSRISFSISRAPQSHIPPRRPRVEDKYGVIMCTVYGCVKYSRPRSRCCLEDAVLSVQIVLKLKQFEAYSAEHHSLCRSVGSLSSVRGKLLPHLDAG